MEPHWTPLPTSMIYHSRSKQIERFRASYRFFCVFKISQKIHSASDLANAIGADFCVSGSEATKPWILYRNNKKNEARASRSRQDRKNEFKVFRPRCTRAATATVYAKHSETYLFTLVSKWLNRVYRKGRITLEYFDLSTIFRQWAINKIETLYARIFGRSDSISAERLCASPDNRSSRNDLRCVDFIILQSRDSRASICCFARFVRPEIN